MQKTKLEIAMVIIDKQQQIIDNQQKTIEGYEKLLDKLSSNEVFQDNLLNNYAKVFKAPKPGSIDADGTVTPDNVENEEYNHEPSSPSYFPSMSKDELQGQSIVL